MKISARINGSCNKRDYAKKVKPQKFNTLLFNKHFNAPANKFKGNALLTHHLAKYKFRRKIRNIITQIDIHG